MIAIMLLTVFVFGCQKEDGSRTDKTKSEITGTWRKTFSLSSYTFDANDNFVDSIFTSGNDLRLLYVIKGKYDIVNDFISFKDIYLTYHWIQNGAVTELEYTFPQLKFSIKDNRLSLTETEIFTPIKDNQENEIYGKWETQMLVTGIDTRQDTTYTSGIQLKEVDFPTDTSICKVQRIYKFGNTTNSTSVQSVKYDYSSHYIKLETNGEPSYVYFKGNMMYWEDGTSVYEKIK